MMSMQDFMMSMQEFLGGIRQVKQGENVHEKMHRVENMYGWVTTNNLKFRWGNNEKMKKWRLID